MWVPAICLLSAATWLFELLSDPEWTTSILLDHPCLLELLFQNKGQIRSKRRLSQTLYPDQGNLGVGCRNSVLSLQLFCVSTSLAGGGGWDELGEYVCQYTHHHVAKQDS